MAVFATISKQIKHIGMCAKSQITHLCVRFSTFGCALQFDRRVFREIDCIALRRDPRTVRRHQDGQRRFPRPDGRIAALSRAHLALVHAVVVQSHRIQFQVVFAWCVDQNNKHDNHIITTNTTAETIVNHNNNNNDKIYYGLYPHEHYETLGLVYLWLWVSRGNIIILVQY